MPDKEKVVRGLEYCIKSEKCSGCIYWEEIGLHEGCHLNSDALTLLKEQEAVEPEVEVLNEIDRIYRCPKCHRFFFYEKQKYCDKCGQAVKWE